jgi:hypothetical protein
MQSLVDNGYPALDLCDNMKQWLDDVAHDIRVNDIKPNVYVAQPLTYDQYKSPAIFIFPESFANQPYSDETINRALKINIHMIIEYGYKDITRVLMRWVDDVAYLLRGYLCRTGTADSGSNTTLVDAALAKQYDDDMFNDKFKITITGGTGGGLSATVTDYNGTTGAFAFADIGAAIDNTSEYQVESLEPRWTEDEYLLDYSVDSADFIVNQKIDDFLTLSGSVLYFLAQKQTV